MNQAKIKQALEAGESKAKELGVSVSIAIVDQYGDLLAFTRMDNALKISPQFAIAKAYTSGSLGMPTHDLAGFTGEGKPYFGLQALFGGKLTTIAGGVPVKNGEQIVGGVGVGGSYDVTQDSQVAAAVAAML